MLPWLGRRRETDAEVLRANWRVSAARSCAEARRREYESSDDAIALRWNRVALAVAHKTGKGIGLDTSTRMAMNAVFTPDRWQFQPRARQVKSRTDGWRRRGIAWPIFAAAALSSMFPAGAGLLSCRGLWA
jgi:hypothetical protein